MSLPPHCSEVFSFRLPAYLRAALLALFLVWPGHRACAQAVPAAAANAPVVASNPGGDSSIMPGSLPSALALARHSVERYFETAANLVCTESVTQAIVAKNGKATYREESVYDYQLQANTNSGSLKLIESRDTRKAPFRDAARTLLVTNGFTSMLLIVHPEYENSYTFEADGAVTTNGTTLTKIRFQAIAGGSSPAAMKLRGENYPIPLSGTLWIDPQTGAVSKLVASTDSSLGDLGLQGMRSEIHYAMIQFHDPEETYRMPISATIDVETPRQHWRNVHRFGNCKRFRATIKIEGENKQ